MEQVAKIEVFGFKSAEVRSILVNGDPRFVGKDVCQVLGIANHKDALGRLAESMKSVVGITDPHGRVQKTTVITEAGVYKLAFRSNKAEAEAFTDWLAQDVIPSIRKTGAFVAKKAEDWKASRHQAAATFKVMSVALEESRKEVGKDTERHHYTNEARLVNWAVFGAFAAVNRDGLHPMNLDLLAAAELKNTLLIARGYAYDLRKPMLKRFVDEERARLTPKLEGVAP